MANFKVPRNVRFVTEWPMTGSGKVQKFKLKEDFMKEYCKATPHYPRGSQNTLRSRDAEHPC